jgi:hypothetical protein
MPPITLSAAPDSISSWEATIEAALAPARQRGWALLQRSSDRRRRGVGRGEEREHGSGGSPPSAARSVPATSTAAPSASARSECARIAMLTPCADFRAITMRWISLVPLANLHQLRVAMHASTGTSRQ